MPSRCSASYTLSSQPVFWKGLTGRGSTFQEVAACVSLPVLFCKCVTSPRSAQSCV